MFLNFGGKGVVSYLIILNRKHEMFLNMDTDAGNIISSFLNRKHEMFLNYIQMPSLHLLILLNRKHEMFLNCTQ